MKTFKTKFLKSNHYKKYANKFEISDETCYRTNEFFTS